MRSPPVALSHRPRPCLPALALCPALCWLQGARLRFPPGCHPAYEDLAMSCMEADAQKRPTIETVLAVLEGIRKEMY